ncbi:serine/threonine-protein kinase (plasmid) [Streptomyces sp. NBC_01591]|uniref:serine/threonine-protein kinase n=1 Tax=Streptomyces sp. NBC_01591 TaxID=2975888 RepID=UPI002DDB67AA|nr:PQQ-binding-like beta-propeller repeat protein [Streptomyces sp. NBC_01591]WSD74140.1 serine/threonine-protein kinase [Streptomyces sp. NBC_01591]
MGEALLAGRYQLKRLVGRGGMGEVWEAFDERLGRTVAVKVVSLLAGGGSAAGELRARFLREARITAALEHPRIVAVHDLGEAVTAEGSAPFLVMEFLRGEGLETVVRRGPVSGLEAARWGAQICEALAEAHAGGILHRDIKPANVFITTNGGVKVLDFGIARAADPAMTGDLLTRTGVVVGTAAYMAPEQARGRPEERSDLYAVGCLLFELLTGTLPFSAPDALGHLTAHLNDTPPAPSSVLPGISTPWDELVLRLLEKEPGGRYASAAQLAAELRALNGSVGRQAVPSPRTPTVVDPGGPSPDATTATSDPQPPRPPALTRRSALRWGAGALALGAAGTAAAVYLSEDPDKGPVAWSQAIGDAQKLDRNNPTFVVSGGRWYVASGDDPVMVHAFDASHGKRLWKATQNAQNWNVGGSPQFAVAGPAAIVRTKQTAEPNPWIDAFDTADGSRLWRRELDSQRWDVHRPSGLLVVAGEQGVIGVDPRTGRDRWRFDPDVSGEALSVGDLVISGGTALSGRTGKTVWRQPGFTAKGRLAHPLGRFFLCYEAGKHAATDLVCRSARTGDEVWRKPFNDNEERAGSAEPAWQAVVSGTTVFLPLAAGGRRRPTAVDAITGTVKWTYDGPYQRASDYGDDGSVKRVAGVQGVLGVSGGFALPTGEGTVCLDADNGRERWRCPDEGARLTGRYLLFTTSRERLFTHWGRLRILDAGTARELWTGDFTTTFATDPQSGDGRVFIADKDSRLWALRI